MTGKDLIQKIQEYNLEDREILERDPTSPDGDYLYFKDDEEDQVSILWVTDDWFQDIRYIREGELTHGSYSACVAEERRNRVS